MDESEITASLYDDGPYGIDGFREKRAAGKRTVAWVTGISGSGRLEYMKLQRQLALANGENFEIIDISRIIGSICAERNLHNKKTNILNWREHDLENIRKTAYDRAVTLIKQHPDTDFAVVNHACFHWDNGTILGYHPSFFDRLQPDICLTIIDNEVDISRRLNVGETHREQWACQEMGEEKVIQWMSSEFAHTKLWANKFRVPWYAITRYMSPTTLFMLLYHTERPWTYYAQQFTHAAGDGETYDTSDEFFTWLMRMFAVTNPKGYEIYHFDGNHTYTSKFTETRDTEWMVPQNEIVVAKYVRPDGFNMKLEELLAHVNDRDLARQIYALAKKCGPAPSEGVAVECATAFRLGKYVFRIWPPSDQLGLDEHYINVTRLSEGCDFDSRDLYMDGQSFRINDSAAPKGEIYCSPFVRANSHGIYPDDEECKAALIDRYGEPLNLNIPGNIIRDAFSVSFARRGNTLPPGAYNL